jgi:hypothetical protein
MRFLAAFLLLLGLSDARAEKVAVASFELVGSSSADLRRSFLQNLSGGLAVAGLEVVPEAEVARSRARVSGLAGCDTMSCLHRIAELVGVKTVVKARIEVLGSNYVFVLDRIDPVLERAVSHIDDNCQVCTIAEANEALSGAGRRLGGAAGNNDEAKARELDASAAAAYAAGRFQDAARDFEQAYTLAPRTPLLWNIAQAYRRQYEVDRDPAKLRRARVVLRNLLGLSPPEAMRKEAEALAAEIDAELARTPPPSVTPSTATAPIVSKTETPPPKKPVYRRWQLWLGVGLGVAAAVGIGLGVGLTHSSGTDFAQAASNRCAAPGCSVVAFH